MSDVPGLTHVEAVADALAITREALNRAKGPLGARPPLWPQPKATVSNLKALGLSKKLDEAKSTRKALSVVRRARAAFPAEFDGAKRRLRRTITDNCKGFMPWLKGDSRIEAAFELIEEDQDDEPNA